MYCYREYGNHQFLTWLAILFYFTWWRHCTAPTLGHIFLLLLGYWSMTRVHCMHLVEQSMILCMSHLYCINHYDPFIPMWSLFLREGFLEVLFHMVMWRGVPHTYQVCVWSLPLCRSVGARACGSSPGQSVYIQSMPGKREALGRCWFNVGPLRRWLASIDPALV